MTRLIDADALAKVKFHGYPEIDITPSDVNAEAYKRGWNDAIDAIIESGPSIDAVKHGRWIKHVLKNSNIPWGYDCSVCDEYFVINEWAVERYKFCPNCGARMDGRGES